jgi:hypothetical protein
VGNPDSFGYNPDFLKLVPGSEIGAATYVALSHCWGGGESDKVPPYCTTQGNISDRQVRLSIADLPLTFRDAVQVARGLKVQYLWIDSLCIMQGEGGDWKEESKRMEDVYTSAYCTIAATRAVDSNAGFLKRDIRSEYVCVQDNLGRPFYVCTCPADFDEEVERARLNNRAWVMQERFLSRRTVHFGANQMYWECDSIEEVRAVGTSSKLICANLDILLLSSDGKKKHFKLDPKFPDLLLNSGFSSTMYFLQSFLVDYSNRGLSKETDRVVALSGLAARIARALGCHQSFGIFELYLHRNLLWRRSDPMKRIEYEPSEVPSWSWMAYTGGIEFMDDAYGKLEVFKNLNFSKGDQKALVTNVWEFRNCNLKEEAKLGATRRQILESSEKEIGWIMYDVEGEKDLRRRQSVVIGRTCQRDGPESNGLGNLEYHILLVRQRGENEYEYERVGIGMVQQGYLLRQQLEVRIL